MTDAECREDVKACINWYEARNADWLPAVTWITFKHWFGSFQELRDQLRWPYGRPKVQPRKQVSE
jgi:hypothetical protein